MRILSGGERNRLLLAKLFTKPSNVLVMDEPTNDLDVETLELLEELLLEYAGTLLLVSHDREFLNNVVTSTLVLEGDGEVQGIRRRLRRLAAAGGGGGGTREGPGRARNPAAGEGRPREARRAATGRKAGEGEETVPARKSASSRPCRSGSTSSKWRRRPST